MLKLTVDSEASDATKSVTIWVAELLVEEILRLVDLWRITWAKAIVNLQQRRLMLGHASEEVELLFGERVENERIARVGDNADRSEVRCLNRRDHVADRGTDAAKFLAGIGVDNEFSGVMLRLELRDLDFLDFVEQFEELVGRRIALIKRAQEGGRRELRRLVDSHRHDVLLGDLEFDPRATLRNDARLVKRAISERADDGEVDTRRTVQLAHDATL